MAKEAHLILHLAAPAAGTHLVFAHMRACWAAVSCPEAFQMIVCILCIGIAMLCVSESERVVSLSSVKEPEIAHSLTAARSDLIN